MTEQYAWKVPLSGHYELTLSAIEATRYEELSDVFEWTNQDDVSIVTWSADE